MGRRNIKERVLEELEAELERQRLLAAAIAQYLEEHGEEPAECAWVGDIRSPVLWIGPSMKKSGRQHTESTEAEE